MRRRRPFSHHHQQVITPINAANLRQAHRLIETGTAKGKIVLQGWDS